MPLAPVPILLFDNTEGELLQLSKLYQQLKPQAVFTVCTSLQEFQQQLPKRQYSVVACLVQPENPEWQALEHLLTESRLECPLLALTPPTLQLAASERLAWLNMGFDDVLELSNAEKFSFAIEKARLLKERQQALLEKANQSEQLTRERDFLFRHSGAPVVYINQGMIVDCNQSLARFFEVEDSDELLWNPFLDYLDADSQEQFKKLAHSEHEVAQLTLNFLVKGRTLSAPVKVTPFQFDESPGELLSIELTASASQPLQSIDEKDFLTGLYNRNYFLGQVGEVLQTPLDVKAQEFVLFVTLDNYRQTLEEIGLAHCDQLIRQMSEKLQDWASDAKVIARFSEQVFTLLIANATIDQARDLGHKIVRGFAAEPFQIADLELSITVSVGLCLVSRSANNAFEIMSHAHAAYEQAKRAGGNQMASYQPEVSNKGGDDHVLKLEQAVAANQIYRHFHAFSALQGENRPMCTLSLSLDEAGVVDVRQINLGFQHSALAVTLDKRAATEAMRCILQAEKERLTLQKQDQELPLIIIHLSPYSLHDAGFMTWLEKHCRNNQVIRKQLRLELSADTLFTHTHHAARFFKRFRHIGCEIFIDKVGLELNAQQRQVLHRFDSSAIIIDDACVGDLADEDKQQQVKSLIHEFRQRDNWILSRSPDSAAHMMTLWQLGIDYFQMDTPLSSLDEVANTTIEMDLAG